MVKPVVFATVFGSVLHLATAGQIGRSGTGLVSHTSNSQDSKLNAAHDSKAQQNRDGRVGSQQGHQSSSDKGSNTSNQRDNQSGNRNNGQSDNSKSRLANAGKSDNAGNGKPSSDTNPSDNGKSSQDGNSKSNQAGNRKGSQSDTASKVVSVSPTSLSSSSSSVSSHQAVASSSPTSVGLSSSVSLDIDVTGSIFPSVYTSLSSSSYMAVSADATSSTLSSSSAFASVTTSSASPLSLSESSSQPSSNVATTSVVPIVASLPANGSSINSTSSVSALTTAAISSGYSSLLSSSQLWFTNSTTSGASSVSSYTTGSTSLRDLSTVAAVAGSTGFSASLSVATESTQQIVATSSQSFASPSSQTSMSITIQPVSSTTHLSSVTNGLTVGGAWNVSTVLNLTTTATPQSNLTNGTYPVTSSSSLALSSTVVNHTSYLAPSVVPSPLNSTTTSTTSSVVSSSLLTTSIANTSTQINASSVEPSSGWIANASATRNTSSIVLSSSTGLANLSSTTNTTSILPSSTWTAVNGTTSGILSSSLISNGSATANTSSVLPSSTWTAVSSSANGTTSGMISSSLMFNASATANISSVLPASTWAAVNSTANGTTSGISSSSSLISNASSTIASSISSSPISTYSTLTINSALATSSGTSSSVSSTSSPSASVTATANCSALVDFLNSYTDYEVTLTLCEDVSAGVNVNLASGPSNCIGSISPEIDILRVTLNIVTSYASSDYVEIWLPTLEGWNGRFLATDNKGLSGCPSYDDLSYTSGLGFAVVGDNGGHNSTEYLGFDATQFYENNEVIVDWSYRARHAAVAVAKKIVKVYYSQEASYNYMLGCSNGGRQALQSAQMFPDDFDGIIAGSSVNDFNHQIDWAGRMYVLTGADSSDDKYLTYEDWEIVHAEVLRQCDEPLDGVADGILEDSTICDFNATKLTCTDDDTTDCLTFTQTSTVWNVFSQLYDPDGNLLYTRLAPGAELYSSTNGILHGLQGHVTDWFNYAVWNTTSWDASTLSQTDYTEADDTDALHGNVSSYSGDLSAFRAAGGKLIMYHGLMDPAASAEGSQRYYLHVASTMGLGNADLDDFMRFFRISGMYHCYGGPGAWAFGQDVNARESNNNIISNMVSWVEDGTAPDTMTGTKWVNDDPAEGVEFERAHCRFPYRNTYQGGNPNVTDSWSCVYIDDWQDCGVDQIPRLC